MEAYFPKPMRVMLASFNVSHRPPLGGKFRHTYGFKQINVCEMTKLCAGNPILKGIIDYANSTLFRGVIRLCPYGPGFVRVENASIDYESETEFENFQIWPNGDYKYDVRLFNQRDDNVLTISLILTSSWRKNIVSGNEKF
jgi:hypothetical protein